MADLLESSLRAKAGRQVRGLGLDSAAGEPRTFSPGVPSDPDDEIEALLAAQEEFQRKGEKPSARAVYGASEDGDGAPVGRTRPASLFKQQRQGNALRPPGARGKAFHPEMAALPILEGPGKDELTCVADVVKERIVPDGKGCSAGDIAVDVAETGFPVANHRAIGKNLGTQVRPGGRAAGIDYDESEEPQNEEEAIDLENRRTLGNATPEEIAEWQKQLLQQFGADSCAFLKKRCQEKEAARKQSKGKVSSTSAVKGRSDESLSASAAFAELKTTAKGEEEAVPLDAVGIELHVDKEERAKEEHAFNDPVEAMQALAGGCLNRAEQQKLQWTTPAGATDFDAVVADTSLPPEPAGKVIQLLRFDFEGRICIRTADDEDGLGVGEGLHHHGAESSQAGYTIAELLILTRSTSAPQRALALSILACVLLRARLLAESRELLEDPALQKTGLSCPQAKRAGFGLGLSVFFWHGVARGDIPKHLIEGLRDPVVLVQLAALRAVVALLDGASSVGDDEDVATIRRASVSADGDSIWATVAAGRCIAEMAICAPLDAARELVWPDTPPSHAAPLARRARVTVLTPEGSGGAGGGAAAWPNLLRARLLHAKKKDEVTGVDVLEPLLSNEDRAEAADDDTDDVQLASGLLPALQRCMRAAGTDKAVLAKVVRALAVSATWSPNLCYTILEHGAAQRKEWLCMAGGGGADDVELQLRFEFLHLLRVSCEVGGHQAAAWWLNNDGGPPSRRRAGDDGAWTAVAVVRRAVLDALKCQDDPAGGLRSQIYACAVEGVRIWLAWLDCGVGCDELDSFMPAISTFLHQISEVVADRAGESKLDLQILDWRWLLAALLLRLVGRILASSEEEQAPHPQLRAPCTAACGLRRGGLAAESAGPLAAVLGCSTSFATSSMAQLCTADFACMVMLALQSPSCAEVRPAFEEAAKALLTTWPHAKKGSLLPDPGSTEAIADDEEAPWPLGGAASGQRLQRLARLRAVRCMCLLAAAMPHESSVPWLSSVAEQATTIVAAFAPPLPLSPTSEATVGAVQRDPWASVLVAAWIGLAACRGGSPLDDALVLGRALMLSGCWFTARDLLACTGLRFHGAAEEAVLRAAYQPWAPWVRAIDSVETRHAVSMGIPLPLQPKPSPSLGPPELAFASAPFWALTVSPPREAVLAILNALVPAADTTTIGAKALMAAVPPWLPFVAFAAVLSAPLLSMQVSGEDEATESSSEWAWSDAALRSRLIAFADTYLMEEPTWLSQRSEWLTESLRGLCDRLSTAFTQESYGDVLIARALWAFAAPAMPQECRTVCWGAEDPAVLALLSRMLPVKPIANKHDGTAQSGLLWPLKTYLAPLEEAELVEQAASTLGIDVQHAQPLSCSSGEEYVVDGPSWPAVLAAHHSALRRELD